MISALDKKKVLEVLLRWEHERDFSGKIFDDLVHAVRPIPESEVNDCLVELIRDGFLGKQFELTGWKKPKRAGITKRFRARQGSLFEE